MPGDASTGFTDARVKNHPGGAATESDAAPGVAPGAMTDAALYPRCETAVASMERDERNGIPAEKVAAVIVRAGLKKNPAPLYVAGFKYRLLLALYNLLPARAAVWLVGKFYS